jgi:hypothetical protein
MGIPKQVQRQLEEVAEIERQMAPPADPVVDTPPDPADPQPAPPAEPKLAVVPEPTVVQPTQPSDRDLLALAEQKYRTLEGKYNAEVPRLHAQLKELGTQVLTLTQAAEKAKQPPEPKPATHETLVTAQDEESFGKDLIDVQRRVALDVMREHVEPLKSELIKRDERIAQLEQALQKTGGEVATVTFEQRLASQVPDFVKINTDPKWIAFLDEVDPYTNEPRRAYAEFVYNNGDVEKLKRIVEFFKATTGQQTPQNDVRQQRQTELERQVTPSRTTTVATTVVAQNNRVYTEAEMNTQFNTVRQLNIAGKYEEAAKLEAELSEAYMQGRVRG